MSSLRRKMLSVSSRRAFIKLGFDPLTFWRTNLFAFRFSLFAGLSPLSRFIVGNPFDFCVHELFEILGRVS